ncbi:MAG TPA: Mur ligase family protein, partial [Oligoflexia bacterium]|nr:Mur ligase family protein [Oligoflexia bacterium]
LGEVARLLHALGDPQDKIPAVHVAGTNGKGSVCTFVASMLRAAGADIGQFASPHLTHVTERCLLNGSPVSIGEFDAAMCEVVAALKKLDMTTSFFVAGAAAAFLVFAVRKLDAAVIEVGLGGLHDATNLIARPLCTLITGISYDHTHILGATLAEIARSKAGIIKAGVPVFAGRLPAEAREEVCRRADETCSPIELEGEDFSFDAASRSVNWPGGACPITAGNALLQAPYQWRNLALAVRAAVHCQVNGEAINRGIAAARWPGRVEELIVSLDRFPDLGVNGKRQVLLDAAHNPEGVESLLSYLPLLARKSGHRRLSFVISILKRKNWREMLDRFADFRQKAEADGFNVCAFFTASENPHSLRPEALRDYYGQGSVFESPHQAVLEVLRESDEATQVVITGSIYLLGIVRPLLTDQPFCTFAG